MRGRKSRLPALLLIYTIHPSSRALLTAALKAWERNSLIAGEVMCGPTQLRVSFSVGLSALLRYATMKSVPGLVTIISLPSNLTRMSMMKPYHTKKPRQGASRRGFHVEKLLAGSQRRKSYPGL